MLGGFLGLGLDVELALEADALGVVDRHVEEAGQVLLLPFQVGVEERLVALAAAPERVAVAAELMGHLHRLLHLRGRVGEDVGVGVCRRAAHVARVGEEVGGAPEELHAGGALEVPGVGHQLVEVAVGLGEGAALGRDVAVVKAPEGIGSLPDSHGRLIVPGPNGSPPTPRNECQ